MSNDKKTLRELRGEFTYGEIVRGEHLEKNSSAIDHPQFSEPATPLPKPEPKIH